MEIEGVTLGIFLGESVAIDTRRVGYLVIEPVITQEGHLLGGIHHLDISERLAEAGVLVIVEGVAGQGVAILGHHQ